MKNETEKLTDLERECVARMRQLEATEDTICMIMGTLNCEKEHLEAKQKRLLSRVILFSKNHKTITEQDLLNMLVEVIQ